MKVDGKENVNVIRLEHRGFNLRFQQVNDTRAWNDVNPFDIKPSSCLTIKFDDTLELDRLINMLQTFRDACWRNGFRYQLMKEE